MATDQPENFCKTGGEFSTVLTENVLASETALYLRTTLYHGGKLSTVLTKNVLALETTLHLRTTLYPHLYTCVHQVAV